MNKGDFLSSVLSKALEFVKENEEFSISQFANDLTNETQTINEQDLRTGSLDSELFRLVVRLTKFGEGYVKVALSDHKLKSIDELSLIYSAMFSIDSTELSKARLIENCLLEYTTGNEMIKRLVKLGYLIEMDGTKDKRSKMIKVTELGISTVHELQHTMSRLSEHVSECLSKNERIALFDMLSRLDNFHTGNRKVTKKFTNAEELMNFLGKV